MPTESASSANEAQPDVYRIGAVSRLTGIPAVTLRAWERRYGVVQTSRSEGRNRLYSREDVERLALIKRLVDLGNAISTVANLGLAELKDRVAADGGRLQSLRLGTDGQPRRVAALGVALPSRLRSAADSLAGIDVVAAHTQLNDFAAEIAKLRPDVLVLEYSTVHEETVNEVLELLRASGAAWAVVVYGFGRQAAVEALDTDLISPVRAPVNLSELRLACLSDPHPSALAAPAAAVPADVTEEPTGPIPPRRFTPEELVAYAEAAAKGDSVYCECPQHLGVIISSLAAFENYSAECVNRHPEDAALHDFLHGVTAQARSSMEKALERVLKADGLL